MPRKIAGKPTTLDHERALAASLGCRYVAAVDEVGRGSLAGPATVGVVVIDIEAVTEFPALRDSKLLAPAERQGLVTAIREWVVGHGVGHASPAEIDALGMTAALRLAGTRAAAGCAVTPQAALLDGSYDWLSVVEPDLLDLLAPGDAEPSGLHIPVRTLVKGDMTCQAIAAASILAKVERDALMIEAAAAHPVYGWEVNKGYATAAHRAAIEQHGPSPLHRLSWRLTSSGEKAQSEPNGNEEHR